MQNIIKILFGAVIFLFLGWYLPVSYMNVFSCDDFWFGTNVHMNGFWGNQFFYWENWEGSYTHTFLASLPHAFCGIKLPFLSNLFSFSCLFCSILLFFKTFSKNDNRFSILSSLYILAFIYLFTNGNSEIRFWVCGNITYITECSIVISVISYYHKLVNIKSRTNILIMTILIFLLAGCKINFIAYGIGALVLHDIIFKRKPNRITIQIYLILFVFCLINILAPGNYIRLAEETTQRYIAEQMNIVDVLMFRTEKVVAYFTYSLLLFPLIPYLKLDNHIKKRELIWGGVFVITTFIIDSLLMFICFNDPGPIRVYIGAELSIIMYMLVVLYYIYNEWLKKEVYVVSLSLISLIVLITCNFSIYKEIIPSIEYSKKSIQRDNKVRHSENDNYLKIEALPESHLLLSYFSNDEIWLENVYLPYFDKNGKVIIFNEDN